MPTKETKEDSKPQPQPRLLDAEQTKQVGGGLNPQPLPPKDDLN
jgi:hypothetical protein